MDRRAPSPLVLLVDDDELIGELLVLALSGAGYEVERARDGVQALKWLTGRQPQLMILDLGLPLLDGLSVLAALQQRRAIRGPATADFPILVLSARQSTEDARRAMALGAARHMVKPFEVPRLLAVVSELLDAQASAPGCDGPKARG